MVALDLRIAGQYEKALAVDTGNIDRVAPECGLVVRNNITFNHRLPGRSAASSAMCIPAHCSSPGSK